MTAPANHRDDVRAFLANGVRRYTRFGATRFFGERCSPLHGFQQFLTEIGWIASVDPELFRAVPGQKVAHGSRHSGYKFIVRGDAWLQGER